jgi:hypothetical protein
MLKILLSTVMLVLSSSPAIAQQVTAEIRTWGGQSLTVSDPTFEVFYTIMPSVTAALGGGSPYAAAVPPGGAAGAAATGELAQPPATIGVGSVGFQAGTAVEAASGTLLPAGPASKQGRRQQDIVTLSRSGAEMHIPVSNLVSLAFTRRAVQASPLPPYASSSHFRHSATAVLVDGSQIEADYVNMGTALLRGTTPQGTIDIPWDDIELVRFRR